MVGVSYEVTDNIKVDLGYRFSDIAGGSMFTGPSSASGRDDGMTRHEDPHRPAYRWLVEVG